MDTARIQQLLLHGATQRHYRFKVGDTISVDLPRIPFTRDTEFLRLETFTKGDAFEGDAIGTGEGGLYPTTLVGRAMRPGQTHVIVTAFDGLDGRKLDVQPLDIVIEVDTG